jgi:hypothetical protein
VDDLGHKDLHFGHSNVVIRLWRRRRIRHSYTSKNGYARTAVEEPLLYGGRVSPITALRCSANQGR